MRNLAAISCDSRAQRALGCGVAETDAAAIKHAPERGLAGLQLKIRRSPASMGFRGLRGEMGSDTTYRSDEELTQWLSEARMHALAGHPAELPSALSHLANRHLPDLLRAELLATFDILPAITLRAPHQAGELLKWLASFATRWICEPSALRSVLSLAREFLPQTPEVGEFIAGESGRIRFREFLNGAGLDAVPFVSIGAECMAYDLLARWGFCTDLPCASGYTPFSLAVHHRDLVLRVLESGWGDYAAPRLLCSVRSPTGLALVARKDGKAVWNHHIGEYWSADNFARFSASIERLMTAFDRVLADSSVAPVVFVLHLPRNEDPCAGDFMPRVVQALRVQAKSSAPRLLVLHTPRDVDAPVELGSHPTGAAIIRAPSPGPDYVWFEPRSYNTAAGHAYERRIVESIVDAVSGWVTAGERHRQRA